MDDINKQDNKNNSEKRRSYITRILAVILLFICCIPAFIEIKTENKVIEDGEPFGFFENTKENNVKQAKKNVKEYIKYKYGFTPKIESVFLNKEDYGMSRKTGYAYVKAKYKDKEFNVVIPSNRKSINGVDNYQAEEIKKDIIKMVTNEVGKPYSYEINYISFINENLGNVRDGNSDIDCIQDYYDGSNIKEIITNNEVDITLSYLEDVDLKKLEKPNSDSIFALDINIVIGKFKSKKAYNTIKADFNIHPSEYSLLKAAIYLEEGFIRVEREENKQMDNKYYKFDMKEYDGLYFYSENIDNLRIEKNNNIDWSNYTKFDKLSDDYVLSGTKEKVYVYFPINKVNSLNNYDSAILFCLSEDTNVISEGCSKIGEYYYNSVDLSNGNSRISIFNW